ncbi:hypothetical protein HUS23_13885 [Ectothiorhodospiraceae bacterium 2226]|nr:hypothetical protein HUS23_13885 [Ectothiorhodospiraceae bacterium 2226]
MIIGMKFPFHKGAAVRRILRPRHPGPSRILLGKGLLNPSWIAQAARGDDAALALTINRAVPLTVATHPRAAGALETSKLPTV